MERKKLLIADDSEMNRAILANILDQDYEIIEAADGREAIAALQVYHGEISALLLDIIMPEMDGFAVLEEMRAHGWLEEVPVIMISTETGTATIDHAFALGASDYISRPFATRIIRRRIINTILLDAEKHQLMEVDRKYHCRGCGRALFAGETQQRYPGGHPGLCAGGALRRGRHPYERGGAPY